MTTGIGTPPIARGGWLDALRFIVALMIVLHHFELAAPIPLVEFHPVFERGYLLTNFFLIDSGYVLTRVYAERVMAGRMAPMTFYRARFLRVFPSHLMMTLTLVAMVLGAAAVGVAPTNPQWFDWGQLPAQAALVQAYGVPGGLGWNAPTWTLSALLGCYLLFPAVLRLTRGLPPVAVLAGGVGLLLLANLLTWGFLGYPVYQMPLAYGFLRALPLFLLGVALARFAQQTAASPRLAGALGIAAAVALAVLQYYGRFSLISLGLICVIIWAAGAVPTRRSALVEKAAIVSFAMFITNEVVRVAWFGVVEVLQARFQWGEPVQWALWALGMVAAVVFAFLFYAVFDRPTQNWLAAARKGGRSAPAAAPAPAAVGL